MPIERVFLEWRRPPLHSAVDLLFQRYCRDHVFDMRQVIVVTPVASAGKRLLELLLEKAQKEGVRLVPPDISTVGDLPEKLYTPKLPFASRLVQQLAWTRTLHGSPPERLAAIVANPPEPGDAPGWMALGDLLRRQHMDLAADNLDFADVRSVMIEGGSALMAIGKGTGESGAKDAAQQAIHSALLDVSIDGARSILFNIKGGNDMSLFAVNEAAEVIRASAHPECNIIFGAVVDPNMKDEIHLTVIATGFDRAEPEDTLTFGQRSYDTRLGQPRQEPQRPPASSDYKVRTFEREDLDIPSFLRRSRSNGR